MPGPPCSMPCSPAPRRSSLRPGLRRARTPARSLPRRSSGNLRLPRPRQRPRAGAAGPGPLCAARTRRRGAEIRPSIAETPSFILFRLSFFRSPAGLGIVIINKRRIDVKRENGEKCSPLALFLKAAYYGHRWLTNGTLSRNIWPRSAAAAARLQGTKDWRPCPLSNERLLLKRDWRQGERKHARKRASNDPDFETKAGRSCRGVD